MPNWCFSKLTVTGSQESITSLKNAANNSESLFSLNLLYPMPECLRVDSPPPEEIAAANIASVGFPSWYEWRIEHWGTKWDLCDVTEIVAEAEMWEINFDSAWAPPLSAMHKISGDYPMLVFRVAYFEPMMALSGMTVFTGGECVEHCCFDLDDEREDLFGE